MASYSSYYLTVAGLFRNGTAEQVKLIGIGDCDKQIGVLNIRLRKCDMRRSVTYDTHSVHSVGQSLHVFIYLVNYCDVVAVVNKMLGEVLSHLSASYDYNIHNSSVEDD